MKTNQQLINNIIGQLNGIAKMMDEDKDCFATLIQMKAAKSALNSFINKFLQENFVKCIKSCDGNEDEVCKKFFTEILKNNS